MKRTIISLVILTALLMLAACSTSPQQSGREGHFSSEEDFRWESYGNGVRITGYNGTNTDIWIPRQIQGMPVTKIGNMAFMNRQLTSVTIPDSVTEIGLATFMDNQLTNVIIGNNVARILPRAFENNQLTSMTIPDHVNYIGARAFHNNQLASIPITVSQQVHRQAHHDTQQAWEQLHPHYTCASDFTWVILDNLLVITNYTGISTGIRIPPQMYGKPVARISSWVFYGYGLTSVTIPNNVTQIGSGAFQDNQLTSVIIPNSVTQIGSGAFQNNQLVGVTIPNSVTQIGNSAFRDNRLTSVTIGNSVTQIGISAFQNNQLVGVTIPNSVTQIGNSAFRDNRLTSVTIGNSATQIGNNAFQNNQLTSVIIPNSVTHIRNSAFRDNWLTSLTIPNSVNSLGTNAFANNPLASLIINMISIPARAFANKQLTSVTIGNSVTQIGTSAFQGNQLTSVTIGNSVTRIGNSAFRDNQLTSVAIPSSVTEIDNSAFRDNQISSMPTLRGGSVHRDAFVGNPIERATVASGQPQTQRQAQEQPQSQPGYNQSKLIALLANPLAVAHFGQFRQGERVYTTRGLLRIIDTTTINNMTYLLVMVNDSSVNQPFYIISNRRLNLLNSPFPNTIFEDLMLEFAGFENFTIGGVPRQTFVFRLGEPHPSAQTPRFTTEWVNGVMVIQTSSEEDAILLLNSNFNFPDHYYLFVRLRGIYLEEFSSPLPGLPSGWLLHGTRLVDENFQNRLGDLVEISII